ncbi:phosphatase PAP2 family protein [Candidatus Roizmanbacteria bacterium]|nr:phosphatase PAP2 family protein [Candidatus Roizmanbacteria bacterium]
MVAVLRQTDFVVTSLVNSLLPHHKVLDLVFSFLSLEGAFLIVWLVFLAPLLYFVAIRQKRFLPSFFFASLFTFLVTNVFLKRLIARRRPYLFLKNLPGFCPTDFSFPSGHASVAFAAAFVLSYFDKKRALYYYILAFLIALSRVYLGCHYVLDVVSGALLGVIVAFFTIKISELYLRK